MLVNIWDKIGLIVEVTTLLVALLLLVVFFLHWRTARKHWRSSQREKLLKRKRQQQRQLKRARQAASAARAFWKRRDFEQAEVALTEALHFACKATDVALEVKVRNDLARLLMCRGWHYHASKTAEYNLRRIDGTSKKVQRALHESRQEAVLTRWLAKSRHLEEARYKDVFDHLVRSAKLRRNGHLARSLEYASKALDLARAKAKDDSWVTAHALNELGLTWWQLGDRPQARKLWRKADTVLSEWPDTDGEYRDRVRSNL